MISPTAPGPRQDWRLSGVVSEAVARTSFVGRDDDVALLLSLVRATSGSQIITVTGPAGVGKTRLAAHVATMAANAFKGDVWFAPLGAVFDSEAVADVVLTALGAKRTAGASALAALREVGQGRRLLLVLDNCEHVVAVAAACAQALVATGDSVVLATSRQPLELAAEQVVPISSLTSDSAIELFADRARAADPSFSVNERNRLVVDEVCRRLDGLPLAVELAARGLPDRCRWRTSTPGSSRRSACCAPTPAARSKDIRRSMRLCSGRTTSWTRRSRNIFDRLSVFAEGFLSDAVAKSVERRGHG